MAFGTSLLTTNICSMSSFAKASRPSRKDKDGSTSSVFTPARGTVVTPALKKLLSDDGWNMKVAGTRKQEIHYTPEKAQPTYSSTSESSESEDEDYGDYYRYIGETESLKKLFAESSICRHCNKGELEIEFKSVLVGTSIKTKCKECDTQCVSEVQGTQLPKDKHSRLTDCAVNCLLVLAMILSGDGGTETGKLLGMLDLPRATSVDRSQYPQIEYDLSLHIIELTEQLLQDNLLDEVKEWSKINPNFDMDKWMAARSSPDKTNTIAYDELPSLTASFDMGWQKRSSGRRYDSHSGHAALIGKYTRKPIAVSLLSKFCRVCSKTGSTEEVEEHDCIANFDKSGSSGSMEPTALVELVHQLIDEQLTLIGTVIADDDSSVRAQLKWSNKDWMTANQTNQPPTMFNEKTKSNVKRPDHGRLRYPIPEPGFLGDPSHRTKLVGKRLFELEAKNEATKKGLNKVDCMTIKKNFGYMVKQLRSIPKEEWEKAARAVLEHYFENHSFCGSWCKRRNMTKEELEDNRKEKGKFYRCKERDAVVYDTLKSILDPFITLSRLEEIAHGCDTQANESLNGIIAWFAPKNKTFAGSRSLKARVYLAVGINLVGYKVFLTRLLRRLGIRITKGTKRHLVAIAKRKDDLSEKHKSLPYKRKRQEQLRGRLKQHIEKAEKKRRKTGYYKQGEGFNTCIPIPVVDSSVKTCRHCGGTGHKTNRSRNCPLNTTKS